MADRYLFMRQRSLPLLAIAVGMSFISGCSLPVARSAPRLVRPETTLALSQTLNSYSSQEKLLVAQPNQAYKKAIAKFAQIEKKERLNRPIPLHFQGKTLKAVNVNNVARTVAQGESSPSGTPKPALKPIALTFDDGPWPNTTNQILNVLKNHNVKATFFVVGRQVQVYPQIMKRIVAEGHTVGNHTWNHQYHQFSPAAAAQEIDKTANLIYKLTGVKTNIFRPPGGYLNNGLVAYAQQKKYAVIMWSADSRDWRNQPPATLTARIVKEASAGGIVLLHDGGGNRSHTVQALPGLITQLKKHGYQLVTVPELLEMDNTALVAQQ